MDIVALTAELINISSITGNEQALALFIEEYCCARGYECERELVAQERWNLYVNWKAVPDVVYTSHLDTVPHFISAHIENEYIYGRGACDTKGIIAAMLGAYEDLYNEDQRPSLLFVVDEEKESLGAKMAAQSGRRSRFIVNGEPTDNKLACGHKGVLSYTLTTTGKSGHSAYPEAGSSAIHSLLDVLQDIRSQDWGFDQILGAATTNIGLIQGGNAPNVFAEQASSTVVHRIVDGIDARKGQVVSTVGNRANITFHSVNGPQEMMTVPGFNTTVVSFGSDVPYLRALGIPLMLGPGSIHDAHTDSEKISVRHLHEAVDLYKKLFYSLVKM